MQQGIRRRNRSGCRRSVAALAAALALLPAPCLLAQPGNQVNPVYVDVTTTGTETLSRVREHLSAGNVDEAVRVLQQLLDSEPHRLLAAAGTEPAAANTDIESFVSVRQAVNELIASRPELLARYRQIQNPRAARALEQAEGTPGEPAAAESVWRSMLLTESGLEATLRIAQRLIEDASFESARLVLQDIENHPDRRDSASSLPPESGERSRDAAAMMRSVARYLDRPEVWERAEHWEFGAPGGRDAQREPIVWPESAGAKAQTPLDAAATIAPEGLVSRPLSTAVLRPEAVVRDETAEPTPRSRIGGGALDEQRKAARALANMRNTPRNVDLPPFLTELSILPAANDSDVFVNTGSSVLALDRFTLRPRWSVTPGVGVDALTPDTQRNIRELMLRNSWFPRAEEPSMVTCVEDLLVACTGREMSGGRGGDFVVTALDPDTGALRWSVELGSLDPSLAECSCRGPAVISESRVIVTARKYLPERRISALFMLALDATDGSLRWLRTVGSTGSLPHFAGTGGQLDATIAHRGVVYRVDELGVMAAYRVVDGQALWVCALPREAMQSTEPARAWEINQPIIETDTLVTLSPDRRELLRVGLDDGAVRARRSADILGIGVAYILRAGDRLLGVARARVGSVDLATFPTTNTPTSFSGPPGGGGPINAAFITGRVAVSGQTVIIPTPEGVHIHDAGDLSLKPRLVRLDAPGAPLPLESQLLVCDDARLHSYLLWDTASAMLRSRMAADPADPSTAVTLAELAYRADRPEAILEGVDAALAALGQNDGQASGQQQAIRRRLYEALDLILTRTLEVPRWWSLPPRSENELVQQPGVLRDPKLVETLVDRLGRVASDPGERAGYLLASGRLDEGLGRPADAAARYQQVLDDADLARSLWAGPKVRVAARVEATRRLTQLVAQHGAGIYAVQEQRAADALAALGASADSARLLALCEQFPLGTPAVRAAVRAADLLSARAADDPAARVRAMLALETALSIAERSPGVDPALLGNLGAKIINALVESEHPRTALDALDRVLAILPGPTGALIGNAADVDAVNPAELRSTLSASLAERARWPLIGGAVGTDAQAISGHALMEPIIRPREPAHRKMLALRSERHVSLWAPDPASATGAMVRIWQRALEDQTPTLVGIDHDSAYFAYVGTDAALTAPKPPDAEEQAPPAPPAAAPPQAHASPRITVERVRLVAPDRAQTLWRTDELAPVLAAAAEPAALPDAPDANQPPGVNAAQADAAATGSIIPGDMFMTPAGRAVTKSDLSVVMDERTLVFMQRGGRAIAIDAFDGQRLWSVRTPISRVYDLDIAGSNVVVVGSEETYSSDGRVVDLRGIVQVIDARSGRLLERVVDQGSQPRWVKALSDGRAVVGLTSTVVCLDPANAGGIPEWIIAGPEGMAPVVDAWVVEESRRRPVAQGPADQNPVAPYPLAQAVPADPLGGANTDANSPAASPAADGSASGVIVMQSQDRVLYMADLRTGRLRSDPLDAPRTHVEGSRPLRVLPAGPHPGDVAADGNNTVPPGGLIVSTFQGLLAYTMSGELRGVDAYGGFEPMLAPEPAFGRAITIETVSEGPTPDGMMMYSLHQLDTRSARLLESTSLVLGSRPDRLELIDGRIAVSAGGVTVVLRAAPKSE